MRTRITVTLASGERLTGIVNHVNVDGSEIEIRTGTMFRTLKRAEIVNVRPRGKR